MPRTTKKAAVIDPNMVSIADFCQSQGLNEQIFRLELMQYQEDADSTKIVSFEVAQVVASTLSATNKALPQTTEISENPTPQAIQPSPEPAPQEPQKPQNSDIVASAPSTPVVPGQGQNKTGSPVPAALVEAVAKADEDIELFDLIQSYRNQQILANSQSRDAELVVKLREQRIENRSLVFDQLRDLNQKQPTAPELPELPAALSDEIAALSDELGKQLNLS